MLYSSPRMSDTPLQPAPAEAQSLAQLPLPILEEVIRQLRSTRNDIIRYGVWNIRNLNDDDFNHTDDRKLLDRLQIARICSKRGFSRKAAASISSSSGAGSTTK